MTAMSENRIIRTDTMRHVAVRKTENGNAVTLVQWDCGEMRQEIRVPLHQINWLLDEIMKAREEE